jgi:hypothetical protein
MENQGVICDVCACMHNTNGCKCSLPKIQVTEQCSGCAQEVETPHFCKSFQEK